MPDRDKVEVLLKQRKVLADFGDVALQSEDLDAVLTEACRLVGEALGTGRAKVLEIEPGGQSLFVRAGVGWAPDVVGQVHLPMEEHSSETYAITLGEPVISQDIREDDRFEVPPFMKAAGVVALANVPIVRPGKRAFGLLQVDDTRPRAFDQDDIEFLRTYATILGPIIDRLFRLQDLRATEQRFGAFVTASNDVVYRMSPDWSEMRELQGRGFLADMLQPSTAWQESYIHPDDRAMVGTAIDQAIRTQSLFELEHRVRHAEGRLVWVLSRAVPIKDADGQIVEWLGAARDVTAKREAQDALRVSEVRLAAIFANASVGLSEITLDGRLLRVNDELCRILGRSREELLSLSIADVTHPEDLPRTMGAFGRVLQEGGSAGLDKRYVRPDGSAVWANSHGTLLRHGNNDPDTLLVVTVDLTARHEAEAALRESEDRFRAIVETATDYAIFTTDAEGRIQIWPQGAEQVFGWTAEEAVGQPVEMTFTPEDRAEGVPAKERQKARNEGLAPNVRWHMRKDGSRVFIDGVARPLTGPGGTVTGFVKVGQDVTERRATEEALRESEARFQQFGEASSDVLWIRDCETLAYEYLSPAYEQVYGSPREEALKGDQVVRWMELIHPEDREKVLDLLRRVRAGENAPETYRIRRPSDGQVRWIRSTDFPLRDANGRVQRIGGVSHDVTEEVETRERLEVLVNELQHRTRNLITVVNSIAAQTMAHTGPTEAFREEFGHRLAALARVQGLLSRGQQEPITLRALLTLELDALGAKEGERVRLDGPWVRIRPTIVQTLALVVHELATNARKYGALAEGGGRLAIEWYLHEVGGQRRVFVDWREENLSPTDAAAAAERSGGYGRRLIERALPYSLSAKTTYQLEPTQMRCTIDLPLDREPQAR